MITPPERKPLPRREEIEAISDLAQAIALEDEVQHAATKIETDLEFRDGDTDWERRARGALTAHQICLKNLRRHIHYLRGGKSGPAAAIRLEADRAAADRARAIADREAAAVEMRRLKVEETRAGTEAFVSRERQRIAATVAHAIEKAAFGAVFVRIARETLPADIFAELIRQSEARLLEHAASAAETVVAERAAA